MLFVFITSLITLLCLIGLIRTAKDKNPLGVTFSLVAMIVFGFFSIATFLEYLGVIGT